LVLPNKDVGDPGPSGLRFHFAADSYITFASPVVMSSDTPPAAQAVEFWVTMDSLTPPDFGPILSENPYRSGGFYMDQNNGTGQIRGSYWASSPAGRLPADVNQQKIVGSWSTQAVPGFIDVNGNANNNLSVSDGGGDPTSNLMIGTTAGNSFLGWIAEVRVWLTTNDTNTTPDHLWRIDEGVGTVINDEIGGNTGTLVPGGGSWGIPPTGRLGPL
jgi:hypothetical protein